MKEAILVRGSVNSTDYGFAYLFAVLGLIAALIAILVGNWRVGAVLALLPLAIALDFALRVRSRRWVRDLGDGIMVIDRQGEYKLADSDFLAMALIVKDQYDQGELKSRLRRFILWTTGDDSPPVRMEMTNTIPAKSSDPLASLIQRVSDLLFQRAQDDLQSGRPALGERWTIHKGELTIRSKEGEKSCALAELTVVDTVDADYCIWRSGDEEAYARVPRDTANAYILARLVADHFARYPADPRIPAEEGLGRLIFERSPSRAEKVGFVLLTGVLTVSGIAFAIYAPTMICSNVFLFFGAVCGLTATYMVRTRFRCHEHGVSKSGIFGTFSLKYEEVKAFSYSAVRKFSHMVYMGTHFRLCFEPIPGRGLSRIRHAISIKNADEQLDRLRDNLARHIAGRLSQQLTAGENVRWTRRLTITPKGIEYRSSDLFAFSFRKPRFIRFSDISDCCIDQGFFFVWRKGRDKPVLTVDTSDLNFFPGFFLLKSIVG